ncbi:transposase [Chloroflexota bacterium]
MKRGPQGRYSKEFREEAVKLVTEERLSVPEAGRRLSLPPSTIVNWVKKFKAGELREIGKTYRPLTDVEMYLSRTVLICYQTTAPGTSPDPFGII